MRPTSTALRTILSSKSRMFTSPRTEGDHSIVRVENPVVILPQATEKVCLEKRWGLRWLCSLQRASGLLCSSRSCVVPRRAVDIDSKYVDMHKLIRPLTVMHHIRLREKISRRHSRTFARRQSSTKWILMISRAETMRKGRSFS